MEDEKLRKDIIHKIKGRLDELKGQSSEEEIELKLWQNHLVSLQPEKFWQT